MKTMRIYKNADELEAERHAVAELIARTRWSRVELRVRANYIDYPQKGSADQR